MVYERRLVFVSPLDWMIILLPTCFVLFMGWYSRRYVIQVSDFLSAGRLCGRYLISVADLANAISIIVYIVVSKLTCKEPFNLDRMLHRGKYNLDNYDQTRERWGWKTIFNKLIGITPEYSFWDRVIARSIFAYSIVYRFILGFIIVIIWNLFQRWPVGAWSYYFLITSLIVPGVVTVIVSFWFGIGSVIDMRQLFRDLKNRRANFLDNGQVEGNMSLADKAELEAIDAEEDGTKEK